MVPREHRVRVLYVGPKAPPIGGMSTYTEMFLKSPVREAFDIIFVRPGLFNKYKYTGYRRRLLNCVNGLALTFWFVSVLCLYRPRIVHIATSSYGGFYEKAFLALLARFGGRYVVLHVHGGGFGKFFQNSPAPLRFLIKRLLRLCHRVLTLSEELRNLLVKSGLDEKRVVVLENAVYLPSLETKAASTADSVVRVLFLNHLSRAKGVCELVEAAERIAARQPNACFKLQGPGHEGIYDLCGQLRDGAMNGRIEIAGPVSGSAVERVYRAADIYVLPSHVEAMPMGLLEAMSHALACVVTPVGSIPRIITDRVNGRIVPVGDVSALEQAIEELIMDGALRGQLGARARQTVKDGYDWDLRAEQIVELYDGLLGS